MVNVIFVKFYFFVTLYNVFAYLLYFPTISVFLTSLGGLGN